jgi:hypothetical protein
MSIAAEKLPLPHRDVRNKKLPRRRRDDFSQNLPRPRRCRDDFFQNLPQPRRHGHLWHLFFIYSLIFYSKNCFNYHH